jgi:hypothetical protein
MIVTEAYKKDLTTNTGVPPPTPYLPTPSGIYIPSDIKGLRGALIREKHTEKFLDI